MNELIVTMAVAVVALLAGGGIGFFIADRRAQVQAAKANDLQQRFDDYRQQVTSHFGRTAEHFQAIGQQYKELYEHMASGAETLFDVPPVEALGSAKATAIATTPEVPEAAAAATDIEADDVPMETGMADAPAEAEQPVAEAVAEETVDAEAPVETPVPTTEPATDDEGRTIH